MPKVLYPDENGKPLYKLQFDKNWICVGAPLAVADLIGRHFSDINKELNRHGRKLTITDL